MPLLHLNPSFLLMTVLVIIAFPLESNPVPMFEVDAISPTLTHSLALEKTSQRRCFSTTNATEARHKRTIDAKAAISGHSFFLRKFRMLAISVLGALPYPDQDRIDSGFRRAVTNLRA
jgi:hypothetical protein